MLLLCRQDEMIELQEREEQATQEEKLNAERDAHNKLMGQANLEGVESLIDDMVGMGGVGIGDHSQPCCLYCLMTTWWVGRGAGDANVGAAAR